MPAAANGRFPRAQRLLEHPRDPEQLLLSATFGLLVTRDFGASWHHVCEAAFGVTDLSVDAQLAFTESGTLLAALYSSVTRASSDTCDFPKKLGFNNRETIADFTLSVSRRGRAVAALIRLQDDGSFVNQLYVSDDDGETWDELGEPLPESLSLVLTVDVAPSDDQRLYVSGVAMDGGGVLLRSDDGGLTFRDFALPTDVENGETAYIAAVDPEDPDALYVRTDLWSYDAAGLTARAGDALLYSADGGASFEELLRASGKLYGFSLSPDGSELVLGYGDPLEAAFGRAVVASELGIYRAATETHSFEHIFVGAVGCLTWSERGLYVCTHEADTGFSLGFSPRVDFDLSSPVTLEPLLRLRDVLGPLECAASQTAAACPNYWYAVCASWGRDDCEQASIAGAPQGASGGGGAAGESTSAAGGTDHESGGGNGASRAQGGCDCRGAARTADQPMVLLASLLALHLYRRRRGPPRS
jgi:hypothetical protein